MKQTGYVTEIFGDRIKVRVERESSCGGHCASCKGCPSGVQLTECKGYDGVRVGDRVELITSSKGFYTGVLLGYGLPAASAVAGAVVGYMLFKSESLSVLCTAAGLAAGLTTAKAASSKHAMTIEAQPIDDKKENKRMG